MLSPRSNPRGPKPGGSSRRGPEGVWRGSGPVRRDGTAQGQERGITVRAEWVAGWAATSPGGVWEVRVGRGRTRPEGVYPPPGGCGLGPELMPRNGRPNHPGTTPNWAPKPPQFGPNSGPVLSTFFCEKRAPKHPQKRVLCINEYNQSLITQMRRTEALCFDPKVLSIRTGFEANCTPQKRASIDPKPRIFSPNVTLGENLGTFGSGLLGIPAPN